MKKIQWFPGHMTKALREMEENIKKVDLVIYVLDSRAPKSCLNPKFNEIIGAKPIIFVLNKSDLADEVEVSKWAKWLSRANTEVVPLVSTVNSGTKIVISAMQKLLAPKLERNKQKGISMPLRAMVLGVPNCGKSTLINSLCGKYKAKTGDKPSVTKSTQWVKVAGNIELLDTPGTLWPSFEDDLVAHNLAYINAIKSEVLDITSLALDFIEFLLANYRDEFLNRYNLKFDSSFEPINYYEALCLSRGFLLRGGEVDWERGAKALLDDFRGGRLGKIMLEKVSDFETI